MSSASHAMPEPFGGRLRQAGRVQLRLRSGEAPESIPARQDVVTGLASALSAVDGGGPIDRAMGRFGGLRIARNFASAHGLGRPGRRHQDFDSVEEELGLSRTFRLEVDRAADPREVADALSSLSTVEMAEPDYLAQTTLTAAPMRGGHGQAFDQVGGGAALAVEPGDPGVTVAVVDSGIDLRHPEFRGRLVPGLDTVDLDPERGSADLKLLGDVTGRDRIPHARHSDHGTACAGIIGAAGARLPRGLAGLSRVMPARALAAAVQLGDTAGADDPAGPTRGKMTAVGALSDIDAAVKWAADLGARVLNLSFGTPEYVLAPGDRVPHAEVIRYGLARGCIFVAASGNEGRTLRYYPAALPGVIAVGSIDASGRPSSFSTRGSHVALCAPGEDVLSASIGGYGLNTGTSFAAPFVAAAVALLIARAARYSVPLGASSVRSVLTTSADPFPAGADSHGCGAGILNVLEALRLIDRELADSGVEMLGPEQTVDYMQGANP